MKNKFMNNSISAEVMAAFLDGNATAQESAEIIGALSENAGLRELLHISRAVDAELGLMHQQSDLIPMTAMAATCNEDSYCSLECEKFVLRMLNIDFDEEQLLANAIQNGWQKRNGTALYNVGRHLEEQGLVVMRRYESSVDDIIEALNLGQNVIVAVDGGELLGDRTYEIAEDIFLGKIPDHTVVVLSVDADAKSVTIYDPNSPNPKDIYPLAQFEDAWNDSKNYMVTIATNDMKTYIPRPIDLSDVELTDELNELREAIAENAHDVWAAERQAQGWTYGAKRDDQKKETPCMVAYSQLPESEKTFDREMAMNTLKLLTKLGYDIVKRKK